MAGGVLAVENADAIPWLVVAGVVLVGWFVLFGVVARATMPRLPEPGPETMELGPETPAVANFLANRWEVTTSAIAATLVDLAARRIVALEPIGDGDHLVRLRSTGTGARERLKAYETQVVDLVRDHVVGGTVPAHELSLGYGESAERWWKRFRQSVIDDARDAGLARRRFSPLQAGLLVATLAVPFAIAGAGLEVYGAAQRAAGDDFDTGGGLVIAGVVWLLMVGVGARRLRGWRDTTAGSEAAARWLGVRAFLRHDDAFRDTPPAGVAIWERVLAYGAGLGVAYATVAALPIGPTRNDEGWSPYRRGLWREVRIEYPRRFAYGDSPGRAVGISVFVLIVSVAALVVVARTLLPAVIDAVDELTTKENGPGRWLFGVVIAVFGVPLGYLAFQALRRIVILLRAVPDLSRTETLEGYVVRVPWHYKSDSDGGGRWEPMGYVAVDDGTSDEVRALRYAGDGIREGQTVRVTLTPRLRHVRQMEVVAR